MAEACRAFSKEWTMWRRFGSMKSLFIAATVMVLSAGTAPAELVLDEPQIIQDSGEDLWIFGYSVPSCADWDADGKQDLIVGEGGSGYPDGRVRIYRNVGSAEAPAFAGYVYAMAGEDTLTWPAAGCLGLFPRVVNWDDDGRKDLLVGTAEGTVRIYRNVGTDTEPLFDNGAVVQAGLAQPENIDIGFRATPTWVDWNLDGRHDLLIGAGDGRLRLYLDTAVVGEPQFATALIIQQEGADLVVPGGRSSPDFTDCDGDGCRDLLVGNTAGQLLLYSNVGTDADPGFISFIEVLADGRVIDLPGEARSRPFVCDWTGSGQIDVLIGSAEGLVYFYEGREIISAAQLPPITGLLAAYPNPFNPRVNLIFVLAQPQHIELAIYSVAGQRVARLASGNLPAGEQLFSWDGRDSRGSDLPSGQYIVYLNGAGTDERRKITLLR
jgi:hypothetical protein